MYKRLDKGRGEVVAIIVDRSGRDYYTNDTGALVVELLQQPREPNDVVAEVVGRGDPSEAERLEDDTRRFLELLRVEGLVREESGEGDDRP